MTPITGPSKPEKTGLPARNLPLCRRKTAGPPGNLNPATR